MKIIDAQVHIWSQAIIPPGGGHRQVSKLTAQELFAEMDEAGVDAGLIHPHASWDPTSNGLAIEAVKKYPDRFAIMGQFPPENRDNARLIRGWRNQTGMMGLRWAMLYREQPRQVQEGEFDWIGAAADEAGLPLSFQAGAVPPAVRSVTD